LVHRFVYAGVECQQASGKPRAFALIHRSVECHVWRIIGAFKFVSEVLNGGCSADSSACFPAMSIT
jgi:hypothetical protein